MSAPLLSVFQINLRLILVSGKTKEFLFSPNDSAADIAKHVYDNWPMGKPPQSHRRCAWTLQPLHASNGSGCECESDELLGCVRYFLLALSASRVGTALNHTANYILAAL